MCRYVCGRRRGDATLSSRTTRRSTDACFGSPLECRIGPCRFQTLPGPVAVTSWSTRVRATACLDGHPACARGSLALPARVRDSEGPADADAGIRTRVTAVTGPHASRTTPRRLTVIAPRGIEPLTSGSKVPRPSPAETPGLRTAVAVAPWFVPAALGGSVHRAARSHYSQV